MPCNSLIGLTPIRTIRAGWARIGVTIYKKWFFTFWAKRIFKLRQLSNLFKQHTSCNGHIAITIHIVSCLKITPAAPAQSSHTLGFCPAWEFLMGGVSTEIISMAKSFSPTGQTYRTFLPVPRVLFWPRCRPLWLPRHSYQTRWLPFFQRSAWWRFLQAWLKQARHHSYGRVDSGI